ncbi:hypothetical protein IGI04_019363 [Brassica rapa subsp. trilocularis]|uniref:40S ribosomal protein S26 n=1 Tax=Brassica rapa subsp. trilocularis TaxID=1813537 RepID=A0ABQ7MFL8_BRACM|nr:hypothetical protein IGI04_019363 [Brassica rapa subsp. trilocularis]
MYPHGVAKFTGRPKKNKIDNGKHRMCSQCTRTVFASKHQRVASIKLLIHLKLPFKNFKINVFHLNMSDNGKHRMCSQCTCTVFASKHQRPASIKLLITLPITYCHLAMYN